MMLIPTYLISVKLLGDCFKFSDMVSMQPTIISSFRFIPAPKDDEPIRTKFELKLHNTDLILIRDESL